MKRKILNFSHGHNEKLKYLIVDFGASLNHTHHKLSISSFAHLLKEEDYEIWIPIGSEVFLSGLNPKRVLLPGTHPIGFSYMIPASWVSGIHGILHNFAIKKNVSVVSNFLLNITAIYFYILIRRMAAKQNIAIIFPTFCPFAMRAIKLLNFMKIEIKIFARLTNTAERRGIATGHDFLKISLSQTKNFNSSKIKFGVETQAFRDFNTNLYKSKFHLSPIPSRNMPKKESAENQKLVVSFLGYPTVDKGQEHILPIIQSVGKFRRDISWQVQITEDNVLKNQLDRLNSNIEILEGKISQPRLEEALSLSSVICLPYNVLAFKLNSSAMMYNSSDYFVPIITFEGSAFARDVSEFSCGLALKDRSDMIKALNSINLTMIQRWIDGCKSYNQFRNQTNLDFLEINKVKE
jgi:glycosyltransferase involved in cell wall biosynthesis